MQRVRRAGSQIFVTAIGISYALKKKKNTDPNRWLMLRDQDPVVIFWTKLKKFQENEGIEHPYQVVDVERTGSSWQCSKCNEAVSKDRVDQVRYHPYPVSTFKNGYWRYC